MLYQSVYQTVITSLEKNKYSNIILLNKTISWCGNLFKTNQILQIYKVWEIVKNLTLFYQTLSYKVRDFRVTCVTV